MDNDAGDGTPTIDAFAQSFSVPANLTEVKIRYVTASLDSNAADQVWGNLYTVDNVYWPDYGVNDIGEMEPVGGYQLYLDTPGTLIYPPND